MRSGYESYEPCPVCNAGEGEPCQDSCENNDDPICEVCDKRVYLDERASGNFPCHLNCEELRRT